MALSKKTLASIEAVLYIACHSGTEPVRSKDICAYQGVTLRYLEHLLQHLVHAHILKGIRGPKGGYLLARDRRKISLCDIYDCVHDLEEKDGKGEVASPLKQKILSSIAMQSQEVVRAHLAQQTIQDLCERVRAENVQVGKGTKSDFII